ncbi:hypothetical protein F4781DRAFT_55983 [Annulohypoxylon bovei var. microspora]|nr:hypothetical protein F4781DRAFT_55983 [Annulohypoxylon bovei var. microspora]
MKRRVSSSFLTHPSIYPSRVFLPRVSPNSPAAGRQELLRLVPKESILAGSPYIATFNTALIYPSCHPSCILSDMQTDTCSDPVKRRSMPKAHTSHYTNLGGKKDTYRGHRYYNLLTILLLALSAVCFSLSSSLQRLSQGIGKTHVSPTNYVMAPHSPHSYRADAFPFPSPCRRP